MNEHEDKVTELIAKAAKAEKSEDAMRFSQAALNAAHALQSLQALPQYDNLLHFRGEAFIPEP